MKQIIQQPDGLFAIFSTIVDAWVVYDATYEEIIEEFAEEAAEDARHLAKARLDLLLAAGDERPYRRALTYQEADERNKRATGRTLDEERALPTDGEASRDG